MFLILKTLYYSHPILTNFAFCSITTNFINMILNEIIQKIDVLEIIGNTNIPISQVAYNSKYVKDDSLFVAIKGNTVDGHSFIENAILAGAKAIVCESLPNELSNEITYIRTSDSRKTLAQISNIWYDFPSKDLKIIGVTGTNGKTTVTFLIKGILSKFGKKVGIIGTTGIYVDDEKIPATHTTPESLELFELLSYFKKKKVEYVVMEVSSHSLVQSRVECINFQGAIFTNLTHDHLDYHKTMENYALAKQRLFNSLDENSFAIINGDDDYKNLIIQNCKSKNIIEFGRNHNRNFKIVDENISLQSNKFKILIDNNLQKVLDINSNLIGKFNIDNIVSAIISCYQLGFNLNKIIQYAQNLQAAPGRMEKIMLPNSSIGIVDYAHTPDALLKALNTISEIKKETNQDSKLITVFGCGGDRDKAKRPIMGKIAAELSDIVIVTSDNPRTESPEIIIDEIINGIPLLHKNKVIAVTDRAQAIKEAYKISKENDILLVAGKGHEEVQIIGNQKIHFSDKEELQNLGKIC